MTSLPKVALSMLISVLVFAGCLFFSFAGGFRFVEIQYYAPRVVGNINERLEEIKSGYGEYFTGMDEQFRKFLSSGSVASYIEREPSRENMDERDRLCISLFQKNPGLEGIRLIENDGIHVHFSTFQEDILSESENLLTYSNYTDRIPFVLIEAKDGEKNTLVYFDNARNRLVFSYPFYDAYTACRGTIVFYIAGDDFTRYLIGKDVVSLNARGTVLSPSGFVFNLPIAGRDLLVNEIQERWAKRYSNIEQISESDIKKENLFVISTTGDDGIKIGWICSQSEFEFTEAEKIALLICLFMTLSLTVFLLFNIRHDDMVMIRRRIRKFQYELLKEYIERKDTTDWKILAKEIASRRMDVNDEIKKSLGHRGKKHSEEVDSMLESSWKDIMSAVGAAGGSRVTVVSEIPVQQATVVEEVKTIDEAEAVEELEEAEPVEEAESVEELEEAEPVEDAEAVEELEEAEPVEEAESVEELEEAEPVDEAEPVEETTVVEQSLSEVVINDMPEKTNTEELEQLKQNTKNNFTVSGLNFSNLDKED